MKTAMLSPGAKNAALLLAHGRDPIAKGISAASLREAHHAGIIGPAQGPGGWQWQVSVLGLDMLRAEGAI